MSEALNELSSYIGEVAGKLITGSEIRYGELTLTTEVGKLVELITFLREDVQCGFVSFIDLCGVDYSGWGKCVGILSE